jgi:Cu(I)/Ag(I) efflux system membrane fusion protein
VERGEGLFTPRLVETGRRFDDRVEIAKGLQPGERIVVSGNFLINSETRLKDATAMYEPATGPEQHEHDTKPAVSEKPQSVPRIEKITPHATDRPSPASSASPTHPENAGYHG